MRWQNNYLLYLLALVPVCLFLIGYANQVRHRLLGKFAETRFHRFFLTEFSRFFWNLKMILLTGSIMILILASARPQWDKEVTKVRKAGLDIVICLDISKSMEAKDIQPSRIDRAKDQMALFMDQLQDDRIALVPFAGRSYVQFPLTGDYEAAKTFLDLVDTESTTAWGTDIGGALQKANELFGDSRKYKVIVLISDGEDLEEGALDAAKEIAESGTVIFSIGVGSPEGVPIRMERSPGNAEYAKDDDGNIVMTRLDVTTLAQIARIGKGEFYQITPQQMEIFEILKSINNMEKKKIGNRELVSYKDQYKWFVLAVLVFLVLESLVIARKKGKFERVLS